MKYAAILGRSLGAVFHGSVALSFLLCAAWLFRPEPSGAADQITIGLDWLPETEHCGFFQAEAEGLYRKAGLNVRIVAGGPDINLPLLVGSGRIDLALGTSFTTLNMVRDGIDGVTVASFFQKDPQMLVAHGGAGVTTLGSMRGHPIMVGNLARQEFWQFLKANYGFTDDQLAPYNDNPAAFLTDRNAIEQGYVTQDGLRLGSRMPEGMVSFLLADYGFDNYSSTLFGMRPWIAAHSDQLRRLVQATAQGFKECTYGDARIAMKPILALNPEHGEQLYRYKQRQMRNLGLVGGGDAARLGVGAMTDARWHHFYDTMVAAGLYPRGMNWHRAYTLDFIRPADRVLP